MGMHDVLTVCDGLLHGEPGQVPGVCQGGRAGGTTSSPSRPLLPLLARTAVRYGTEAAGYTALGRAYIRT